LSHSPLAPPQVAVPAGDERDFILTGRIESLSAEAAVDVGKCLIDGGDLKYGRGTEARVLLSIPSAFRAS